jgi:hypothetical protein
MVRVLRSLINGFILFCAGLAITLGALCAGLLITLVPIYLMYTVLSIMLCPFPLMIAIVIDVLFILFCILLGETFSLLEK